MCRSVAQGGQRCAAHTRPRYEAATFGTPEWDSAAAEYASTPEGRSVLLQAYGAERSVERSVALFSALSRGEGMREVNTAVAGIVVDEGTPHITSESGTNHVYWNRQGSGWITTHSLTNARRDAAASSNRSRAVLLDVSARMVSGTLENPQPGVLHGRVRVRHNGQGQGFTVENRDLECNCPDYQRDYDCEHVRNAVTEIGERINQERVGRRHAGTTLLSEAESIMARAAASGPVALGESEIDYADDYEAFKEVYDAAAAGAPLTYLSEDATGGLGSPDGGRGFGIELEFVGGNRQAIAQDLYDEGLIPAPRQAYYHSDPTVRMTHAQGWKFETDCTVDGEIISPVMYDTPETWENVAKVCEIVKRHGGRVSTAAGSHVHVSTGNYGADAARYTRLLGMFHENEDTLYRLAANPETGEHRYRSGSTWCQPNPVPSAGFTSVENMWSSGHSSHSQAMNFGAVRGRPGDNVEFRMWDATLDPAVIQTQIVTSLAMTEAAYRPTTQPSGRTSLGTGASAEQRGGDMSTVTSGFRSFLDTVARRKVDKDRLISLFARNKWQ